MARESAAEKAARERLAPPADWQEQDVHSALLRVMRDLPEVGKTSQNVESPEQFWFRGIDAIVNAVGPLLRKHGVLCLPKVLKASVRPVRVDRGEATIAWVRVRYTFRGPDRSKYEVTVPGEAIDTGDKALSKAMSVAWRICLIQALSIPTGERDPDASSYKRQGGGGSGNASPSVGSGGGGRAGVADPRQDWWDAIAGKAKTFSMSTNDVRRHFARWSGGRQIDGRGVTVELLQRYHEELTAAVVPSDPAEPQGPDGSAAELAAEERAQQMVSDQLGAEPLPQEQP